MLKKIVIENYRCYESHQIEFKNISIIVGKNNAGKSTLIEALRLVSLALNRFKTVNYVSPPKWTDLPLRVKGIIPSIKNIGFTIENLFHHYNDPPSIITAEFQSQIRVKIYIGEDGELFCTLQESRDDYVTNKARANQINMPQMNILPQIGAIPKKETVLNRDYVRQNVFTDLASLHFRNQIALYYEAFPKFKELSEEYWNGISIDSLQGRHGLPNSGDKLSLMVRDGKFVSEIGWMGSGLQMWLQIMWFLARVDENEIVILDEPDVYMHPDLQRKLIRLLKNRFKNVIVSTHSIEIISEVEPTNILIIDKNQKKSLFANKVPVVQRILDSIGSIHNLQLTKLWASKKLLIVEGDDVAILKRFQNILFPNSEEPFDTIPNFDIGGWGGWYHARGGGMLLKETVDDKISIYCIFDSDYHTQKEIEGRKNEALKIGVNIHIWKRKELENYLIVPTTILRILKKDGKGTEELTVNDVEKIISNLAEEMKEDLIDSLATEIQKEDKGIAVNTARDRAKKGLNNLNERICGKDLISELSKYFQKNYQVSLSPIKIAKNLEKSEIVEELKQVIIAIETCGKLS